MHRKTLLMSACLVLLCSCVGTRDWYAAPSNPPAFPAEIPFTVLDPPPGRGGNLFVTLRLEHGEELLFMVDTGSPVTILDRSLQSRLGNRLGTAKVFLPYYGRRRPAGVYRAPKLYVGNSQLVTSKWVVTDDVMSMAPGSPLRGVLGMDCLRHYCVQLDFPNNKLRFLDPEAPASENLGKPHPLTFSSGPLEVYFRESFFDLKHADSLIELDTGIYWDGATTLKVLRQAVQEQKAVWTTPVKMSATQTNHRAHFQAAAFSGDTYSDLLIDAHFRNSVGLRFLARHLVTMNFPKRTMYLLRQSTRPLPQSVAVRVPEPRVKLERANQRLDVRARLPGNESWIDLATFVMDPQLRPYLHPLRDASGRVVLTEDRPDDHPWQHGIFTGFHRVNGFNYWKEDQGKQRFVRLLEGRAAAPSAAADPSADSDRVSWRALVEFIAPDGAAVLEEEDAITFHAPESADAYVIDFDLLLRAKDRDVNFGKFFVGGLAVRMPWDKSNPRHTHLNSNGLRDRACEQQRAAWCNVERPFGDQTFGIAIFDHPSNPNHPPAWRADEQGLINPNISGLADWSIPAKHERLFRYRILVYRGSATREQLAARFADFSGR